VLKSSPSIIFADQLRIRRSTAAGSHSTPEDRDARAKQWCNVTAVLEYWSALRQSKEALLVVQHRGLLPEIGEKREELCDPIQREREAMAKLLLTPAPSNRA
jgi:hypothetical protein